MILNSKVIPGTSRIVRSNNINERSFAFTYLTSNSKIQNKRGVKFFLVKLIY